MRELQTFQRKKNTVRLGEGGGTRKKMGCREGCSFPGAIGCSREVGGKGLELGLNLELEVDVEVEIELELELELELDLELELKL